jgi:hypothetical protein
MGFHLFNRGMCHLIRGLDEMYTFINLELKLLIGNFAIDWNYQITGCDEETASCEVVWEYLKKEGKDETEWHFAD